MPHLDPQTYEGRLRITNLVRSNNYKFRDKDQKVIRRGILIVVVSRKHIYAWNMGEEQHYWGGVRL